MLMSKKWNCVNAAKLAANIVIFSNHSMLRNVRTVIEMDLVFEILASVGRCVVVRVQAGKESYPRYNALFCW